MYNLENLFVGYNDGKNEAKYRKDFDLFYYNYDNIYDRILEDDKFLLLGKKGTGKSLLAEYIKRRTSSQHDWFCEIASYKEFRFHELVHLKSRDIKPNEYTMIWEWIILLGFAKMCITDQSVDSKYKDILEKFIVENYYTIKLDMNKVIEITKKGNIKGSLLNIGAESAKEVKYENGSYIDYIDDLKNTTLNALKNSKSKFTLIFDELDDQFRNEDIYKSNIISLIKVCNKLNSTFFDEGIKSKAILLLRTDIFNILNDPDLNKIEHDKSVKIDWGNLVSPKSPLFDMVFKKVKQSINNEDIDNYTLYRQLFPQKIKHRHPDEYILGRTYFRPRDVVSYLDLIIKKYPKTNYFGSKGFIELEEKYSSYFFKEIRNEMYGHISEEEIYESFLLLKQLKRTAFSYQEVKKYYEDRKGLYSKINLEKTLKYLFDFGAIGNRWIHEFKNKPFYAWSYRENVEIDYDKDFVVHLGLRKELTL